MHTPIPATPAAHNEALGALVDDAAVAARDEAAAAARKACALAAAHALSLTDPSVSASDGPHGWSSQEVARRSLRSEVACALKIPERTAETLIADSVRLVTALPATLASLSDGRISWRHAQLLVEHTYTLPDAALAEFETLVLPFAETHTATRFNQKARVVRERMHPESIELRHTTANADRHISVEPAKDGMAFLTAFLPAATAHAVFDRLDRAAIRAHHDGDPRTLAQLRADTFAGALLGVGVVPVQTRGGRTKKGTGRKSNLGTGRGSNVYPIHDPHGVLVSITGADILDLTLPAPTLEEILATIRPQVQITVPVLSLLGRDDTPATLDGYGPIDQDTARSLTSQAPSLTRLLTDPETAAVRSVGRKRYRIPKELRRWLQTRDGTCRFPGCGKKAGRCHIDHTQEWHNGGTTAHDNLAHLCEEHHRLKTLTGWSVEQIGDGALRWTSPLGKTYLTHPTETMGSVLEIRAQKGDDGAA